MTGQRFTDHINVLVNVSVNYHPVYGLQLTLHDIDVSFTLGALEQQRLATLDRLVAENPDSIVRVRGPLHHEKQKASAALRHSTYCCRFLANIRRLAGFPAYPAEQSYGYRFQTAEYFTAVQGDSNAEAFVDRLIDIFDSQVPYDAVVIIRGGGAQTDFLIFDNYRIARAIARFPIPVITGIGHQKNQTIADLMAHTATKTPTRAAELIIDHNRAFEERIGSFQKSIIIKSQQAFSAISRH
jgi:exodeoxyribonuclease VII large subunit